MANQSIKFVSPEGWMAPTFQLLREFDDFPVGSAVTASPGVNDPSLYSATFNDVPAGRYRVLLKSGGKVRDSDHVTLKDADGDYPVDSMRKTILIGDSIRQTNLSTTDANQLDTAFGEII